MKIHKGLRYYIIDTTATHRRTTRGQTNLNIVILQIRKYMYCNTILD